MDPTQNPLLALGMAGQGQNGAQQPLGGAMDPRSQYLTAALAATQKAGQTPGNAMGLDANLMAEALERFGLQRNSQQQAAQSAGNAAGNVAGGLYPFAPVQQV